MMKWLGRLFGFLRLRQRGLKLRPGTVLTLDAGEDVRQFAGSGRYPGWIIGSDGEPLVRIGRLPSAITRSWRVCDIRSPDEAVAAVGASLGDSHPASQGLEVTLITSTPNGNGFIVTAHYSTVQCAACFRNRGTGCFCRCCGRKLIDGDLFGL